MFTIVKTIIIKQKKRNKTYTRLKISYSFILLQREIYLNPAGLCYHHDADKAATAALILRKTVYSY